MEEKSKSYWYKFIHEECVICGDGRDYKIRVYDEPEPENPEDKYEIDQTVCQRHFL